MSFLSLPKFSTSSLFKGDKNQAQSKEVDDKGDNQNVTHEHNDSSDDQRRLTETSISRKSENSSESQTNGEAEPDEDQTIPPSAFLRFNFNFNSEISILKPNTPSDANLPDAHMDSDTLDSNSITQTALFDCESQNSVNNSIDILLKKNSINEQIQVSDTTDSDNNNNDDTEREKHYENVGGDMPVPPPTIDFASLLGKNKSKIVRLSSGKVVSIKPKNKSTLSSYNELKTVVPSNYGVNIKEIYLQMEHRARMEQISSTGHSTTAKSKKNDQTNCLWAEKYRPKSFFDLVGNEKANRSALKWLRHWTKATYGEDIREELENLKKKEFYQNNNVAIAEDPFQRPKKRILLLAGPPGIGKTTIAHLMCKHLGYDTMEINASDERAGQEVKNKIHDSMDTHSFSGKPKCIVADEIDGASENGFVKVLIDLIYSDIRATRRINLSKDKGGNNQKKDKNIYGKLLLRPIVAICNDVYAPVLEKLKPHCEIINFKKPRMDQISSRLGEVIKMETKHSPANTPSISNKELSSIIEVSNFDIRSCLNLLQFNRSIEKNASSGQKYKDLEQSWFLLLAQIFKLNVHESKSTTFDNLQRALANSSASMDKIINGCFQKYPQFSNYKDVKLLNKAESICDWLYFYDIMNCSAASNNNIGYIQSFELAKYGNETPMKFFLLFAEGNSSFEKYSSDNQSRNNVRDFFDNKKHNQYILEKSIINNVNMKPSLFTLLNRRKYLSIEILPLVNNYILNPDITTVTQASSTNINAKHRLRTNVTKEADNKVNFDSNRPKAIINHIIDIIQDFDFSIGINDKNTYNGQGFEICPVTETLTKFDTKFCSPKYFKEDFMYDADQFDSNKSRFTFNNLDSSRQKVLKYAFFEIEKRKAAAALINSKRKKDDEEARNQESNDSEHRDKLPKNVRTSLFFTNLKNNQSMAETIQNKHDNSKPLELKVWVKYHEGFSNAVRKTVTWDELWI